MGASSNARLPSFEIENRMSIPTSHVSRRDIDGDVNVDVGTEDFVLQFKSKQAGWGGLFLGKY